MTVRHYLIPVESTATSRGPKYFAYRADPDPPALIQGVAWAWIPFGSEPTGLIAADVDTAQHATLAGLPDVTTIPANLDLQVGANLATVQASLEALNIPADTLTANNTYRQVLRGTIAIFKVSQRFRSIRGQVAGNGRLFPPGVTMATTLGALSDQVRQDLSQAVGELGYNQDGLTLASTLRDVLKKLASQPSPESLLDVPI